MSLPPLNRRVAIRRAGRPRGLTGLEVAIVILVLAGLMVGLGAAAVKAKRAAAEPHSGIVTAKYTKHVYRSGEVPFLTLRECHDLDRGELGPIEVCEDNSIRVSVETYASIEVGDHYSNGK